jgi:hypothetical protein
VSIRVGLVWSQEMGRRAISSWAEMDVDGDGDGGWDAGDSGRWPKSWVRAVGPSKRLVPGVFFLSFFFLAFT